ncbi:MAG: hypothetical protein JOY93_04250, partial [Acidobacteriales bacterium]|nr:hypothetical protein [Terriglobales bacterium]
MGKRISKSTHRMRGFTLIATLLTMVLLSGIAVGLMFLVNGEGHLGGNDREQNLAFYGAESGMEKLTTDLANLYATTMSPTPAQITALTTFPPTAAMVGSMNYNETITWTSDANGNPVTRWNTISGGPYQGLVAEIIPMTRQTQATRPAGA